MDIQKDVKKWTSFDRTYVEGYIAGMEDSDRTDHVSYKMAKDQLTKYNNWRRKMVDEGFIIK